MLKISRLNPAPRTIAVYASPSPSPVTTQHSLAGGRYLLPAPGLPPAGARQLRPSRTISLFSPLRRHSPATCRMPRSHRFVAADRPDNKGRGAQDIGGGSSRDPTTFKRKLSLFKALRRQIQSAVDTQVPASFCPSGLRLARKARRADRPRTTSATVTTEANNSANSSRAATEQI